MPADWSRSAGVSNDAGQAAAAAGDPRASASGGAWRALLGAQPPTPKKLNASENGRLLEVGTVSTGGFMQREKAYRAGFWALSALVLVPSAGTGVAELFAPATPQMLEGLARLGYPLYLVKIVALAKILGAMAILSNRVATLREWAYAGFSFLFLGAAASHILANDAAHAPPAVVFFVLLMGSYACGNKARALPG